MKVSFEVMLTNLYWTHIEINESNTLLRCGITAVINIQSFTFIRWELHMTSWFKVIWRTYCRTGWSSVLKTLEVIQKKFLKIMIKSLTVFPSHNLYKDGNVYNLRQLFHKQLVLNQYKEVEKFTSPEHNYGTRQKVKFVVPHAFKTKRQRSFKILEPVAHSILPRNIQNSSSLPK